MSDARDTLDREQRGAVDILRARLSRYETAMREALTLAENWKATSASKVKDYGDARDEACSGDNYDDAFSGGYDLGAATMRGECATEMLWVLAALSDQPAAEPAESKLEAIRRLAVTLDPNPDLHSAALTDVGKENRKISKAILAILDAQPITPEPKGKRK